MTDAIMYSVIKFTGGEILIFVENNIIQNKRIEK